MFKTYYRLTKPGIIYGNALTAAAGFFLAAKGHFDFRLFFGMLIGVSFVIAFGCVINNVLDSDIDAKMERTKKRAMVTGSVSKQSAIIYGIILGLIGSVILYFYTNILTLAIAVIGILAYIALYTPLKRRSVHGTLIGAVSGAAPPLVGYCAVTNHWDLGALILFFILIFWQMPHFYAIAIYRLQDYAAAELPVLPVKKGIAATKIYMLFYIIAFIISTALLNIYGFAGYTYLIVVGGSGLIWLGLSIKGFRKGNDDAKWARKMFLFSLIVITLFCVVMPIDAVIR